MGHRGACGPSNRFPPTIMTLRIQLFRKLGRIRQGTNIIPVFISGSTGVLYMGMYIAQPLVLDLFYYLCIYFCQEGFQPEVPPEQNRNAFQENEIEA